ncbi:hypothetical protein GCM10007860_32250 [Chitiniphilus shinanonensis]|uniref:Secreted protein n=1 Tax=Chitiniphilus shinanonensis TaxID=553088 RepID=A0ABQ6BWI7_9NEIS|nr:hypothetical protein GCM10007860_32250 [Chitiniphilus shinanonensis]
MIATAPGLAGVLVVMVCRDRLPLIDPTPPALAAARGPRVARGGCGPAKGRRWVFSVFSVRSVRSVSTGVAGVCYNAGWNFRQRRSAGIGLAEVEALQSGKCAGQ